MGGYKWLWPTFKTALFDDVSRVFDRCGSWDLVIFTGDLTQRGDSEEFKLANQALAQLWEIFDKLGFRPSLFCIPGNHDLARPAADDPALLLLKRWWEEPTVRDAVWNDDQSLYRKTIRECFGQYNAWLDDLRLNAGIPALGSNQGIFPGDQSCELDVRGTSIGLIGLNSSWLQLDGSNYEKKLLVDVRQLNAVTGGDPDGWCRGHAANLIMTHHPVDWLHPDAERQWRAEICPAQRFNAHLFGHMHEASTQAVAQGGSAARLSFQAPSVFGLEFVGDGVVRRHHGYTVDRLQRDGTINVWPRTLRLLTSGGWKMVPDHSMDLSPDDSLTLSVKADHGHDARSQEIVRNGTGDAAHADLATLTSKDATDAMLDKTRYYLPASSASTNVRRVEQRMARAGLETGRVAWIVADWGAGSDGFLKTVASEAGVPDRSCFRLDLSDFVSRVDYLAGAKSRLGFTVEQLCEALSEAGRGLLIVDEIPLTQSIIEPGLATIENEVEVIVDAITTYCPNLFVVIRSRQTPRNFSKPIITLSPLDEVDLRVYVSEHEHGGAEFTSVKAVSAIFRHTDGVPARVDSILRELELITIDQLASIDPDLNHTEIIPDHVPLALAEAVAALEKSEEPTLKRSFDLLKALSSFPQGESIERLKRFYGSSPIFPVHARELLASSLISASSVSDDPVSATTTYSRQLVVPRTVRNYIRNKTGPEELSDLTKRAANLYFGPDWHLGRIRAGLSNRYKSGSGTAAELTNASAIVVRLLNEAVEINSERAIVAGLEIATSFITSLFGGDHYRSVIVLARDLLAITPDVYSEKREYFSYELARALRMIGSHREALSILMEISFSAAPLGLRQNLQLTLALVHQSLENEEGASAAAREVVRLDKASWNALQAKAVLLELQESDELVPEGLRRLEETCRRRGAHTVANNLVLSRLEKGHSSSDEVEAALRVVLKTSREKGDFYNLSRAAVKRAELFVVAKRGCSEEDMRLLISVYQYLLSERLERLFDRCHACLWWFLEQERETDNLFRLFRRSSLIWRLREDHRKEAEYLKRLAQNAVHILAQDIRKLNREAAYYFVRAASQESLTSG